MVVEQGKCYAGSYRPGILSEHSRYKNDIYAFVLDRGAAIISTYSIVRLKVFPKFHLIIDSTEIEGGSKTCELVH